MANVLVHVFIDSILKQPFESNSSALLNAILVQVGLIKVTNCTQVLMNF